ncbi:PAS domain S-box protein [Pseudothauera nasutitermitis]|uniref:PAS domain S-box protein n=1 Tax=Pseudothauera nasutitermitis TaxID=2565930 RepID=UPI001454D5A5|nr:PAS domain S-box protein [Pseudothauera nasutitermitis]
MLCFWLIVSCVLALTAALTLWNARSRQVDSIERNLSALSLILSEQTARAFQSVDLILQGTVERLHQEEVWTRRDGSHVGAINAILNARMHGAKQVRSLFIVGEDGRVAYSALGSPVGIFVGDRDYVVAQRNGTVDGAFIGLRVRNRVDGAWSIFVSRRLEGEDGRYLGVVVASVPVNYFDELYRSITPDDSASIALFKRDGVPLYTEYMSSELLEELTGDREMWRATERDPPQILHRTHGSEPRIVALRDVDGFPLMATISVSVSTSLSAWNDQAMFTAGWVVGVIVLLGLGAFALARELRREEGLEQSLRESQARLQGTISSAMDAIVTIDENQRIVLFNPAAEKLFGCSAADALGTPLERFIPERYRFGHRSHIDKFSESGQTARIKRARADIVARRVTGEEVIVDASISQLNVAGKKLFTAILRDITMRLEHEAELRRLNRQLREFSASLQSVREEERTRIARELHDDLGQQLSGLKLGLSSIRARLRKDCPDLEERVVTVQGQIDMAISSVRRLGTELRPLMLDDLGLFPAVGWLIDDVAQKSGLLIDADLDDEVPLEISDEASSALFRILQESLTNVVRHAEARHVRVALKVDCERLQLRVADDGKGIRLEEHGRPHGSFGLIGIRERVWMLGGEVYITSEIGRGTTVEVVVPMSRPVTEEVQA